MKRVGEGDCQGKVDSLFSAGKRREGIFAGKRREEKGQGIIDRRDNLRERAAASRQLRQVLLLFLSYLYHS